MTGAKPASTETTAPASFAVRPATDADIPAITEIYAHHVLQSLATFEETPPDAAEMTRRMARVTACRLPYLVADTGGKIAGYAYALPYRERSAYRYTVEDSIYVAPDAGRQGVGTALLAELIERCAAADRRQMVAVIGDSANAGSIAVHAKLGFRLAGTLPSAGFKFGRWVDSVIMTLPLGDGDATLPE